MSRRFARVMFAWFIICCATVSLTGPIFAQDAVTAASAPMAVTAAEQSRFFESHIRPLFVDQCLKCHGDKKQWGNLRLDSRAALLTGGDSGPAVVPGKPNESLLIKAVRHEDDNLKMPKDAKLSDRQIADLTKWVEMGAPYADSAAAQKRSRDPNHWAFQPVTSPALPAVKATTWPLTEIDRFILAKIEAAGRTPAPRADKRTLIRRVTFDLTGLPPTPEEVAAFLADERPDAYVRLVDRLLESPHYGERWARHWLDVARYADSNGLDENVAHGSAWRYRDYVVNSFNNDKPINRFIVEQLAGDLLPAGDDAARRELLVATGFLGIGPKVLAETDEAKMRMDIIDEQIDTTGRAFLGLTLGCARCHDHKFDPIQTADYYGLAGIFKSTKSMEKYTKLAVWYENPLPSPEATAMKGEYDGKVATKKEEITRFIAAADQELLNKLKGGGEGADAKLPEKPETQYPEATKAGLKKLRDELAALEKAPPALPSAMGVTEDKIVDVAIHVRGNPLKLGDVAPRHTPPVLRGPRAAEFTSAESGRRQLAEWLVDPEHPLTTRVFVNRVWRWHFGQGLVRSTDNFGLLGQPASHPELLDWLARRFVTDGWSLKSLHRLLVCSATYQQQIEQQEATDRVTGDANKTRLGEAVTASLANDGELFHRSAVRRLEAEEVRDAVLAVSGRLNLALGGSTLNAKNREYLFDHTSKDITTYNSLRRSLYLPVIRNNVYDLFQLLDFPDPAVSTSERVSTVVAPQALMMLNSDVVMASASALAKRLLESSGSDADRLTRLYELAYGRPPTSDELRSDREFLTLAYNRFQQEAEAKAPRVPDLDTTELAEQSWASLCHILFASNEFIYVR